MPPKAADTAQKMLPADCISILLMALGQPSISKATFEMMSALDGTRTASSFEHQFRPITAKAKELKARVEAGETFAPVTPVKKRGTMSPPATPRKRKMASEEEEGTPTKKAARKPRGKKIVEVRVEEEPANDVDGQEVCQDAEPYIKSEQVEEQEYV